MATIVIKIKYGEPPPQKSLDTDFEWLCRSLGLVGPRDASGTTTKVFKAIVLATQKYGGISIPELVEVLGLSRTAVVHHLAEIWNTGLIAKEGMRFRLRRYNLKDTVYEIEQDLTRIFSQIEKIAEDIDQQMGMPSR